MVVSGLLLVGIGLAARQGVSVEGRVVGDGLFAVAAPRDGSVASAAPEGPLDAGRSLVRFRSPELEALADELRLKKDQADAEVRALPLRPLARDPEVVRRHDAATADRRALRQSLEILVPTLEGAAREFREQTSARREALEKAEADLASARDELAKAVARREVVKEQLERERFLAVRRTVSAADFDDRRKEFAAIDGEVKRLQSLDKGLRTLADITTRNLAAQDDLSAEQSATLRRGRRHPVGRGRRRRRTQTPDRRPGRRRRAGRRVPQARGHAARLEGQGSGGGAVGVERRLDVPAPFAGRVFYRADSPAAAAAGKPVVVLGPADGVRLRVRLPANQVDALRSAGEVEVDLGDGVLERRFPARFHGARELGLEAGTAAVELACDAPREVVRLWAEGQPVAARLAWSPPVETLWPFRIGVALVAVGLAGLLAASIVRKRAAVVTTVALRPAAAEPLPTLPADGDSGVVDIGPVGVEDSVADTVVDRLTRPTEFVVDPPDPSAAEQLEGLAVALRDMVACERVESDIVGAAEEALANDRGRAARVFRRAFRADASYWPHLMAVMGRADGGKLTPDEWALAARLVAVLNVIGLGFMSVVPAEMRRAA